MGLQSSIQISVYIPLLDELYDTLSFQHNAEAAHCDSELSLQLKHATSSAMRKMLGDIHGDVPILMSGAGHDAMAMSHLTKVRYLMPYT